MIRLPGRSIRAKLVSIVVVSSASLTLAGAGALNFIHHQMIDDCPAMIRAINDTAMGIANRFQKQVEAGELNRTPAIQAMHDTLHAMRFGESGKDYIFAYLMDGVSLAKSPGSMDMDR